VLRNFCLYCGCTFDPHVPNPSRYCHCSAIAEVLEELEQQERVDVAEYERARPLQSEDMKRKVWVQGQAITLAELLSQITYKDVNAACPPRVTDTDVVQLVYHRRKGSRLYRWYFCAHP
jgi:hypothetical protein